MAMSGLCYPYGAGIECTCNTRGRPVHCVPVLDYGQGGIGEGEGEFYQDGDYMVDQEGLGGRATNADWTEVILAATFLLIIILLFLT